MTLGRGLYLLALIALIGVVLIGIRAEQVRVAAHIEALQRERVGLRRESWALELEVSRLRAPDQVGDRVARWSLDVREPRPPSERSGEALVMAVRQ